MDGDMNHGPGVASTTGNGNVLTERPHTISSAYEKGHQRPSLQPYTFNPPESALTIQVPNLETFSDKKNSQNFG
jgi:hypothetical protein